MYHTGQGSHVMLVSRDKGMFGIFPENIDTLCCSFGVYMYLRACVCVHVHVWDCINKQKSAFSSGKVITEQFV